MVAYLLERGVDLDDSDESGTTALKAALCYVEHAKVDDTTVFTALHAAEIFITMGAAWNEPKFIGREGYISKGTSGPLELTSTCSKHGCLLDAYSSLRQHQPALNYSFPWGFLGSPVPIKEENIIAYCFQGDSARWNGQVACETCHGQPHTVPAPDVVAAGMKAAAHSPSLLLKSFVQPSHKLLFRSRSTSRSFWSGVNSTQANPAMAPRTSIEDFQDLIKSSTRIVALCGAGLSAASGLPTFRGAGGLWRNHEPTSLATPEAFEEDPALVWLFYAWRRHMCLQALPNEGHRALAELAKKKEDFICLTQNVDGENARPRQ